MRIAALLGALSGCAADKGAPQDSEPVDTAETAADLPCAAVAELVGEEAGDRAGDPVSGAGDVNGDGRSDLLVGAPLRDTGGEDAGVAYLVLGPASGAVDLAAAHAALVGEAVVSGRAGYALAGLGDADGDGFGDLLVGAPGQYAGVAYLVAGPVSGELSLASADARMVGEYGEDYVGYAVAGAGDSDGDGRADLLIGDPAYYSGELGAGAAYLVLGPVSGELNLALADATLVGEDSGDYAGSAVAGLGDADGDGLDDLGVGAPAVGTVWIVSGAVSGELSLADADAKGVGDGAGDGAGVALAGAGDVDGDGLADLLVGAPYDDGGGSQAGAAFLVLGPLAGEFELSSADAVLLGAASADYAGASVSGAGDLNGDGAVDLLVGAPHSDLGAVCGVFGPVSGSLVLSAADVKFTGEKTGDAAGASVAGVGDADGDGLYDFLFGAPGADAGGVDAGGATLVQGGEG